MPAIRFIALLAALPCSLLAALYPVAVESSVRRTAAGELIAYRLYVPQSPSAGLEAPLFPAVVLTHGYGRGNENHEVNARHLAERGIVVLTPSNAALLSLSAVSNTLDHVAWLRRRAQTPGDALQGLVDPGRIALAGHSAGGAVSFESAVQGQKRGIGVAALLLLDAVPWSRTYFSASGLQALPFASLRAEPGACNSFAEVLKLQRGLAFATSDVRVVAATHCDQENPTDFRCLALCGGASSQRQSIYQRLMYLFLRDTFGIPEAGDETLSYAEALSVLQASGEIRVSFIVPAR